MGGAGRGWLGAGEISYWITRWKCISISIYKSIKYIIQTYIELILIRENNKFVGKIYETNTTELLKRIYKIQNQILYL